ncbi:MAG: hypothetical protein M3R38_31970 [Actinomycetota bacterium]|nr:hypothetical protein [Actinomycetota bacterium]
MLTCRSCGAGRGDDARDARFERREYVRLETIVDPDDAPVHDEGVVSEPLGTQTTYRCLSCSGHDVDDR